MSASKIRSTRFLDSSPTLFGFTPLELTALVLLMSILSSIAPNRPLMAIGIFALVAGGLLAVRVVIGPSRLVRFMRAITGSGFKGRASELFTLRATGPQFSEGVFDDELGYLTRLKERLVHLPMGVPLVVTLRRVAVDLVVGDENPDDPMSVLRRERREALRAAGPFYENRVYLAVPKKHADELKRCVGDLHLQCVEEDYPCLEIEGLVSGNSVHNENSSLHSFEMGPLPLEFGLRDLSLLLRGPQEVVYTLTLSRKNPRRAIQKYSMKHGSMKGFQGGASSEIEANLSATAAYDTLGQLISGQDGIFAVQGIVTFVSEHRNFVLPQMAFLDSLVPLSHASIRDLKLLHLGVRDRLIERTITGIESAGLLPIPFAWTTPKEMPNFFTPERELLHVSGFQDELASGNAVCFGPSGKGKSMTLANLFAFILEETDRSVVILDNGHGFDNFVRAYGGQTFEMASGDEPARLSFMKIAASIADESARQETLVDFTRYLIHPHGEVDSLTVARLRRLAQQADFNQGLGAWGNLLKNGGETNAAELIAPFVSGGIYGDHFDGDQVPEIRSRVLYFTGPMVSAGADVNPLVVPYFFVVNLLIATRLGRDLPPAKICWDELKYLMQYAPDAVSGMWNRVRKTGNAVICAAQHPGQIAGFSGGEDILENSPTKWLLGLSKGPSPLDKMTAIPADDKAALSIRKPGDFFLLVREDRRYWVAFAQSPLHYALFTTKKSERDAVDELIREEAAVLGNSPKAALRGAMRYLTGQTRKVAAAAMLALCLGGVTESRASIFGEENAPLYAILAKHIEELAILKQQLDKAASQVNEMRSIYENHRRTLDEIKLAAQVIKSKDREMGGIGDKARAVDTILDRVAELKSAQRLPSGLEAESKVVGESMVYQNGLATSSDSTREAGLVITRQARSASPGVAAKLSAQADGLSIQALADIQRSQAEMIRLMTLDAAHRTNSDAEDVALTRKLKASRQGERRTASVAERPF